MVKPRSPNVEPALLRDLRRAVEGSGLAADPTTAAEPPPIVVTGRLAQNTIRLLNSRNRKTGRGLEAELRRLASTDEYELIKQGRGYTFYHVVQFIYEYVKHYGQFEGCDFFAAAVGHSGGGLQHDPDRDITSLMNLLVSAMPAGDDGRSVGLLLQALGPLMTHKVFTSRIFHMEMNLVGDQQLEMVLQYDEAAQVERRLAAHGLAEYGGPLFYNAALQVEGSFQLGLRKMVGNRMAATQIEGLVEGRSKAEQAKIAQDCHCRWSLRWTDEIALHKLVDRQEIIDQARTIYESMHRRELEFFQERIKTLEMRVEALQAADRSHELMGRSPQMHQVYKTIEQVAPTDLTVLLRGPSGTGKELVARAIHQSSDRAEKPFVAINCAAFSETLLESELFGHEKGAFTGAEQAKPGRFEMADGGTLFLDEAGDIPLTTQVKLLRVLETRSFERVGGVQTRHTDVRFIAATNQDLEDLIEIGKFREDFFFRLNVMPLYLPPLRERREDIPQLAHHFAEQIAHRLSRRVVGISHGAIRRLVEHDWPGNVRELRNVIERAVAVYAREGTLSSSQIEQALGLPPQSVSSTGLNVRQTKIIKHIQQQGRARSIEDLLKVGQLMAEGGGNSRRTLQNDLRKLSQVGYLQWVKNGSARVYSLTPKGSELAGTMV